MPESKSLFTLSMDDIGLKDVEEFCALDIRESEIIDYKADCHDDMGDKIVQTIAAMANTDGGLILVGVPELPGTRRSCPGVPVGIEDTARKRQSIESKCMALLSPPFVPEMKVIPMDNNRSLLVIRISKDKVPTLPVFHRTVGIRVRAGESNCYATPDQVKQLLAENDHNVADSQTIFDPFPNNPELWWVTLSLRLPLPRFSSSRHWNSAEIHMMEKLLSETISFPLERYRIRRSLKTIEFLPIGSLVSTATFWFSIRFDKSGYARFQIGHTLHYPKLFSFDAIAYDLYHAVRLLTDEIVRNIFPTALWDTDSFTMSYCISELFELPSISMAGVSHTSQPLASRASFGGLSTQTQIGQTHPGLITKHFLEMFLAEAGYMDFESALEKLDLSRLRSPYEGS